MGPIEEARALSCLYATLPMYKQRQRVPGIPSSIKRALNQSCVSIIGFVFNVVTKGSGTADYRHTRLIPLAISYRQLTTYGCSFPFFSSLINRKRDKGKKEQPVSCLYEIPERK